MDFFGQEIALWTSGKEKNAYYLNTRENISVSTYTGNVNMPGKMRINDGKNSE